MAGIIFEEPVFATIRESADGSYLDRVESALRTEADEAETGTLERKIYIGTSLSARRARDGRGFVRDFKRYYRSLVREKGHEPVDTVIEENIVDTLYGELDATPS